MGEDLPFGRGDHGRKLIEVADEDHLHAAEPLFPARAVQAQEFLDAIEEIGAHHGYLIDDDRVKLPVNIPLLRTFLIFSGVMLGLKPKKEWMV